MTRFPTDRLIPDPVAEKFAVIKQRYAAARQAEHDRRAREMVAKVRAAREPPTDRLIHDLPLAVSRTPLGHKLRTIRRKIIADGAPLLEADRPPGFLSVGEAARRMGVSGQRVRFLLGTGRLGGWKVHSMTWLVVEDDVEGWIQRRRKK